MNTYCTLFIFTLLPLYAYAGGDPKTASDTVSSTEQELLALWGESPSILLPNQPRATAPKKITKRGPTVSAQAKVYCDHPNCTDHPGFTKAEGLRLHSRLHTGEKYVCDTCNYTTPWPNLAKKHKKKILKELHEHHTLQLMNKEEQEARNLPHHHAQEVQQPAKTTAASDDHDEDSSSSSSTASLDESEEDEPFVPRVSGRKRKEPARYENTVRAKKQKTTVQRHAQKIAPIRVVVKKITAPPVHAVKKPAAVPVFLAQKPLAPINPAPEAATVHEHLQMLIAPDPVVLQPTAPTPAIDDAFLQRLIQEVARQLVAHDQIYKLAALSKQLGENK